MIGLRQLLVKVPGVYAELGRAMLPGRPCGEGPTSSPDPRHRPAPGNLDAAEHRHKLLRGLRWWVDAVGWDGALTVGDSPARMCAVLAGVLDVMAPEDQETLRENLRDWVSDAWPLVGDVPAPSAPVLPAAALDRVVPQSVAAQALGLPPSTVWSRAGKTGGPVRIRDVAGRLCVMSDLPPAWCEHCRTVARGVRSATPVLA